MDLSPANPDAFIMRACNSICTLHSPIWYSKCTSPSIRTPTIGQVIATAAGRLSILAVKLEANDGSIALQCNGHCPPHCI